VRAIIVAIHQPHFLPWLGYFDKMRRADLFILLDHVQFERQNFQNRVRVKTSQGPQWLTVPVKRRSHPEPIVDKLIDDAEASRWARKAWLTLYYAYGSTSFFSQSADAIRRVLEAPGEKLVDMNRKLIDLLRDALGVRTPMVRSSELGVEGQKSELLVSLCRKFGADAYLAGGGGSRSYLDLELFKKSGISVRWQEFRHPRYDQHPCPETFVEGLSAIDLLFNCGPRSAALLGGSDAN
jgi:hypothetical protein